MKRSTKLAIGGYVCMVLAVLTIVVAAWANVALGGMHPDTWSAILVTAVAIGIAGFAFGMETMKARKAEATR